MTDKYKEIASSFPDTKIKNDPNWMSGSKVKNALLRAGYTTYRAIAEAPDEILRESKWIGEKSISEINDVLTAELIIRVQANKLLKEIAEYPSSYSDEADWGPTGY